MFSRSFYFMIVLSLFLSTATKAQSDPSTENQTASHLEETTPKGTPPANQPPPPPENPPPPPTVAAQPSADQSLASGQWVYTNQYGWVWMPHGDEYIYTPVNENGEPYEYIYYPSRGWMWVAAPWIWGVGPLPFFGRFGPWHFHWYRGPAYHMQVPNRPHFRGSYGRTFSGAHPGGHVEHRR